ncbi:hypothetical protein VNO77_27764 [Canavalia gladiata]|uniref:Zinc finger PHD-type domain-containing protein n=1 Tax=Canavalia gladiata TaxID=3824 RepID=A0AAN9KUQ4_CANGL
MASEKIDGYLVYRRRNKRTASGVISLNSEGCKGIVENKPEHAEDSNGRDHGGTLIFCKTCCHSYHLQCLSPQLESIPTGEWQCPNCSDNDDLSKPTDNFQTHKKENNSSSSCSICSKAKNLKLSEHEAVKSKSTSADGPNASASLGKSEVRNKWEATLSIINTDNLLLLSEACSSMESMNMPTNSDKARNEPS